MPNNISGEIMDMSEIEAIRAEIAEIKEWLSGRPSASMDPSIEKVPGKLMRLSELKSMLRVDKGARPDTHMMDAQTYTE